MTVCSYRRESNREEIEYQGLECDLYNAVVSCPAGQGGSDKQSAKKSKGKEKGGKKANTPQPPAGSAQKTQVCNHIPPSTSQ